MATTNKSLIQQTYNTGTGNLPANQIVDPAWISTPYTNWSVPVNYDFGAIDLALGGSVSISVTSVVVSPQAMVLSQYQPMSIIFTGVLSANLAYALPSSVGGTWAVYNNTTGAFTLTMTTPAGTSLSVVIPSGGPNFVVCNSTTGISIYQSLVPDGSITAAKLFATTGSTAGTYQVVLSDTPTISSPNLTGTPVTPTATAGTNTTQVASTAFVQGAATPSGSVSAYAGSTAPSGWLLCSGAAVSRSTYAALFAIVGTTYGTGDGSTTFNLPDLRGRVIAGVDNMGGTAANRITSGGSGIVGTTLGAAGGLQTHMLVPTEIPAHQHFVSNDQTGTGALTASNYVNETAQPSSSNGYILKGGATVATLGLTSSTGGGGAHNNTQPTMMLNYIIKT
jgi:microcystin-dependent protein